MTTVFLLTADDKTIGVYATEHKANQAKEYHIDWSVKWYAMQAINLDVATFDEQDIRLAYNVVEMEVEE